MKKMRRSHMVAILLGIVVVVVLVSVLNKQHTQSQTAKLQTELLRNGVIVDSLQAVSNKTPAAAQQYGVVESAIKDNLDSLASLLKYSSDQRQKAAIQALISGENDALQTYTKNLNILSQLLVYNPADDLNTPAQSELTQRAKAASTGISAVLSKDIGPKLTIVVDEISLSSAAHSALADAKDCFDLLAKQQVGVASCIETYSSARQSLGNDLASLWFTASLKQQRGAVANVIQQLQTKTHRQI